MAEMHTESGVKYLTACALREAHENWQKDRDALVALRVVHPMHDRALSIALTNHDRIKPRSLTKEQEQLLAEYRAEARAELEEVA